jgi:hypothetical protein
MRLNRRILHVNKQFKQNDDPKQKVFNANYKIFKNKEKKVLMNL